MPRLIRMTSDKNNGHFDNTFDDEIVLPPYSKIMLHNLQATLPPTEITIDSSNQELKFHLQDAAEVPAGSAGVNFGLITTYLPTGSYSGEGSANNFATQMENTMNGALSTNLGYDDDKQDPAGIPVLAGRSGGRKECGGEWNIGITEPGSTTDRDLPFIEYNIQELYTMKPAIDTGATGNIIGGQGFASDKTHDIQFLKEAEINNYYSSTATETNENPEAYVFGDKFLARGGGVFSTYVRNIDKAVVDDSEQGFLMGFSVEDPTTFLTAGKNEFPISKIMYGIQYTSVSGIYAITNGDGYKGSDGEDQLDSDEFELIGNWDDDDAILTHKPQLQFGFGQRINALANQETKSVLNFRLFCRSTQGSGGGDLTSNYYTGWNRYEKNTAGVWIDSGSDDFTNYWNTTDLYPVVAFWSKKTGGTLDLELTDLQFTSSPSLDSPTAHSLLGHALVPSPGSTAQVYFDFPNSVSDFFNMGERLPISTSQFDYTNTFKFVGFSTITSDINPESFVLELMTYQLDSYDGKTLTTNEDGNPIQKGKGKRMSILATIPRNPAYNNRSLIYEGRNPYYIDLNNKNPLLMRQLFLRLLDFDLEEVVMRGRGSLTLLVI